MTFYVVMTKLSINFFLLSFRFDVVVSLRQGFLFTFNLFDIGIFYDNIILNYTIGLLSVPTVEHHIVDTQITNLVQVQPRIRVD